MKLGVVKIAILLFLFKPGNQELLISNEENLNFPINYSGIFDKNIQMFYALLDKELNSVRCDYNGLIDFDAHMLPLDIHGYFDNRGEEEYYTLLTKTVYGLKQDISYFTEERLSDEKYLQETMPYNKLRKNENFYFLEVGFGAPDITYSLDFYSNNELIDQFPELVSFFQKNDNYAGEPAITVFQHNHTFSKVLGQKTSKMSMSITRYFNAGNNQTLVINYTLNFIHNLPPSLLGGGNLLINQMKEGVIALIRDTRNVCQNKL